MSCSRIFATLVVVVIVGSAVALGFVIVDAIKHPKARAARTPKE